MSKGERSPAEGINTLDEMPTPLIELNTLQAPSNCAATEVDYVTSCDEETLGRFNEDTINRMNGFLVSIATKSQRGSDA